MACAQVRDLISQGLFCQARAELERLIHSEECTHVELAEAYRLASSVYYKLNDLYAAKSCGEKALSLAESAGLKHLVAEAHFSLGITLTELGDTPQAMEHLNVFMEEKANTSKGNQLEPKAIFATGQNLFRRRQYSDAIASYRQAANLFDERGPQNLTAWCWRNIVDCQLMLDRAHAALPYLHQLESYVSNHPDDQYIRNALIVDKAHYYRMIGQTGVSMSHCRELFEPGRPGVDDTHRSECAWIAGLNATDLGHFDEAQMFATQALNCGIKAQWPLAINRANALQQRIATTEARLAE